MREMETERQPAIGQMTWLGFALGVFYWLIDSIVDTYLFHERSLSSQIFSPDAQEIWIRLFAMFITVGAGFFADRMIAKRREAEAKLKAYQDYLEQDVNDRTADLTSAIQQLESEIAGHKETEDALRDSEEKFKGLAERSLAGIYLIQNGKFGYANPRFAEIIGYTVEELTGGMGPADVVVPEDVPILEENIRKRITGEADAVHYELRGLRKSGEVITMEIFGSRIAYKGKPAIVGTLLDITGRKRMEEDLRRRLDELERFLRETTKREFRIAELKDRVKKLEQELREKTERPS